MSIKFSTLSRTCRYFLIIIWILAAAFAFRFIYYFQTPKYIVIDIKEVLFWAVAVILSEALVIHLPLRGCLSIGTAIDIPIILVFGPSLSVIYGILGALSSSLVLRKEPLYKVLFNIALFILTMGISSLVYHNIADGINFIESPHLILAFLLTIIVYFVVNSGLLSIVIGFSEGISPKIIWMKNHSWTITYLIVLSAIGYLMAMVNFALGKWAVVLLLLPVLLIRKAYSQYMDLKKIQDQLMRSERLAAVGQMAAGISHEIDNPMSVILGYSDYLLKKMPLDDCRREDVEIIKKEAERCKSTIREYLDFSRPKAQVGIIDLNAVLKSAISLLRHESKKIGVETVFRRDDNLPKVLGDAKKLEQVFVNLIFNALQAMSQGGKLAVTTESVRDPTGSDQRFLYRLWPGENKNRVVAVKFQDTGCGISEENLKQVFMPFFTTRSEKGGRGLGLYVSHRIIEEHKGTIEISSELGKGTIVTVFLPYAKKQESRKF